MITDGLPRYKLLSEAGNDCCMVQDDRSMTQQESLKNSTSKLTGVGTIRLPCRDPQDPSAVVGVFKR